MAPTNTVALRVDDALATALAAEAARTGTTISDLVRAPLRAAYVRDRPSYGPGAQHSLVRDSWELISGDAGNAGAARQRLDHFRAELAAGRTEFALSTATAPPPSHPRTCRWSPTAPSTGHCGTPAPRTRCPPPARSPCPARSP